MRRDNKNNINLG